MSPGSELPSRRDAIHQHKASGKKIAAVFPIHYPRALFYAHGLLPVEVWGPPHAQRAPAAAHLQAYTCDIVHAGLGFLLSGGLRSVDAIVAPHGCDSLQGLGSILLDFIQPAPPVFPFYLPRAGRDCDAEYFAKEIESLSQKLAAVSGRSPSAEELASAVAQDEAADAALLRLWERRAELALDNQALYALSRARGYLPPQEFCARADSAPAAGAPPAAAKTVVLSGVIAEPGELLALLDRSGVRVGADDTLCLGRRFYPAGRASQPFRRMAERILAGPPDSTRGSSIRERCEHLLSLCRRSGARGVIFRLVKFCEPEQFYLPALRRALEEAGVRSLALETDLAAHLDGPSQTRLEAFLEML